jgi:hypothetical protein
MAVSREGVVRVGDGANVSRVPCHGVRQETACVVYEVGENNFDSILRELGDWG